MKRLSEVPGVRCLRDAEALRTGPFNSASSGVLSFVMGQKYLNQVAGNPAVVAVIVPAELADAAMALDIGVAVADDPRATFFSFHNAWASEAAAGLDPAQVDPQAEIAPSAVISPGARIGPGVVIEPTAFVGSGVTLEENSYVGPGALVGVAGHFEQWHNDRRFRVAHMGRVRVASGAQILAGAIVQRDVYDVETVVGRDVVVGPGVKVGHGVNIGERTCITGGSTIAGYTAIGERVWVGPNSTIGNNLTIGDDARVEIGSVVVRSLAESARVSGNFAIEHTQNFREWAKRA